SATTKSNSLPLLSHKEDNPYPSPTVASYPISSAQASRSSSKVTTAAMAHFKPKPCLPNAHLNSRPQPPHRRGPIYRALQGCGGVPHPSFESIVAPLGVPDQIEDRRNNAFLRSRS